jgi:hypothetical protein
VRGHRAREGRWFDLALPPPAAASNEAVRMVATIFGAFTSTVVIALPA